MVFLYSRTRLGKHLLNINFHAPRHAFNKKTPDLQGFNCSISDLGRIQTCNLLSRNQMRYSVAPRGHFGSFYALLSVIFIRITAETVIFPSGVGMRYYPKTSGAPQSHFGSANIV